MKINDLDAPPTSFQGRPQKYKRERRSEAKSFKKFNTYLSLMYFIFFNK